MSMAEPLEDGLDDLGILNILDFQLDNEDEEGIEDWDASKSQCLGPIPSDLIMGPPAVPRCAVKTQPPRFMPGTVSSIYGTPMQQQSNYVQEASSSHIRRHSKYAEFQEPGIFQMQSPVSVLESNGSSSSGKRIPIRSDIVIPRRTRSKRVRSSEPNRWREVLAASTFKRTSGAKNYMGRRKRLSPMETVKVDKEAPGDVKKCSHCQITSTPQWREGPMGRQTLCNACGVRYRSGRLYPEYRPAASPTFVPSLHSNSHRKVIELRNKAETQPQVTGVEGQPHPQVTRVEGQPHPRPQVTRVEGQPQPQPHPQVTRVERWPQPQVTRVEGQPQPQPHPQVTRVERWPQPQVTRVESWPQPQVTRVESWLQPQVTRVESQPQPQVTRVESWPQPQVTRVERQPQPQPHPQVTRVERQPQPQVTRVERQPQPQPQVTRVERQPQPQPQVTRVEILRIEAVPAMSPQMELVPMSSQFFD